MCCNTYKICVVIRIKYACYSILVLFCLVFIFGNHWQKSLSFEILATYMLLWHNTYCNLVKNIDHLTVHRDCCLMVEYTVLSLLLVFFLGFLYCSFLNCILCLFSVLSIIVVYNSMKIFSRPKKELSLWKSLF